MKVVARLRDHPGLATTLDKIAGALRGDMSATRRFACGVDIECFLHRFELVVLVLEVTPKELTWYKLPGCKTMAYGGVVNKPSLHAYDMVVVKTGEHYDWVAGACIKESKAAAILETISKLGFLDGASVDSYKEQVVAEALQQLEPGKEAERRG